MQFLINNLNRMTVAERLLDSTLPHIGLESKEEETLQSVDKTFSFLKLPEEMV